MWPKWIQVDLVSTFNITGEKCLFGHQMEDEMKLFWCSIWPWMLVKRADISVLPLSGSVTFWITSIPVRSGCPRLFHGSVSNWKTDFLKYSWSLEHFPAHSCSYLSLCDYYCYTTSYLNVPLSVFSEMKPQASGKWNRMGGGAWCKVSDGFWRNDSDNSRKFVKLFATFQPWSQHYITKQPS